MVNRRQLLKISALGTASFAAPLAYSASNITMAYNTGNPIGSTSPKDLSDNARNLDLLVLGPNSSYPDRKGVPRKSWRGMESEFGADQTRRESEFDADQERRESEFDVDQAERDVEFRDFLEHTAYEVPVDYAAGLSITRPTQVIRFDGELYRAKDASLPFTTTTWAVDAAKFFATGDAVLRQNLADHLDPKQGAANIGRAIRHINTMAELKTVSGRYTGEVVHLMEYFSGSGVGGGKLIWRGDSTEADNTGTIIQVTGRPTGRWIRDKFRQFSLVNFGADPTGVLGSADALEKCLQAMPQSFAFGEQKNIFIDGSFLIERGNLATLTDVQAFGLCFIGGSPITSELKYSGNAVNMLLLPSGEQRFYRIRFNSLSAGVDKVAVKTYRATGLADNDVFFHGCLSYRFKYAHHCVGRGSANYECGIGGNGSWALIESPDPFTAGASASTQSLSTGMRRYVSMDLMVDSAASVFDFLETGPAGPYMNEVTVHGVSGNGLVAILRGGNVRHVDIKTGALVNSFVNGCVVDVHSLWHAKIDLSVTGWYSSEATSTVGINSVVRANGVSTSTDLLIDDVTIIGRVERLSKALVSTNGRVGDVTIGVLVLPEAYRYNADVVAVLIAATNGIEAGKLIHIDGLTLSGASPASTSFLLTQSTIAPAQVKVGSVSYGALPFKPFTRNKGSATVPSGASSVVVTHGMAVTPVAADVTITPLSNDYSRQGAWVVNVTSTTFTIQCGATIAANTDYAWNVNRSVN